MTASTHRSRRSGRSATDVLRDEDRYSSSPTPQSSTRAEADPTKAPASSAKSRSSSRSTRRSGKTDSGTSTRKSSSSKTGARQAAAQPKSAPKRASRSPSARGRGEAPPPEPPPVDDSGALEGEQFAGEPRDAITVKIPRSLKARIDGLVTHSAMHGEPEEVESMTDFIRIATSRLVSYYEQIYHRGQPFPAPRRLTPGRRSSRG